MKRIPKYVPTSLRMNKSVIGDSLELTIERLKSGAGIEGIEDRDLVYNNNETVTVNPITDIRSDKMELLADEKIGQYEHERRRTPRVEIEEKIADIEAQGTEE